MKISIIVDDKAVYCGGVSLKLDGINWARFDGDAASPWDNVHAIQFDTEEGRGYVEYKPVKTAQIDRPDIVPPQWAIGRHAFDENFAWVLKEFEAEAGRTRSAAEAAAREAENATPPDAEAMPSVSKVLEETKATNERLAALEADLKALYDANKQVIEGG